MPPFFIYPVIFKYLDPTIYFLCYSSPMKKLIAILVILLMALAEQAHAIPACMDKKTNLSVENTAPEKYKAFMEKGFKTRLLLKGTIVEQTENRQGHTHFTVDLDANMATTDDRIEAIYNNEYGELPSIKGGEETFLCGDFIVDPYSPEKAVIHWLHKSPSTKKHDHGFVVINSVIYGN